MRALVAGLLAGCLSVTAAVLAQGQPQSGQATPTTAAPAASTASTVPELVTSVLPTYPPPAASTKVQGLVELRVATTADGQVSDARVVSSIPSLEQAAVDAVRQWRFSAAPPGGARDIPVRVRFVLSPFPADPAPAPAPSPTAADPSGRRQWIPPDFEFVYRYRCRDGEVHIRTIDHQIVIYRDDQRDTIPFQLTLDDEQRIFLVLVARGFFAAPSGETTRPPVTGIRRGSDGYDVTVVGHLPQDSTNARLELPGGRRRRSPTSVHQLEARQFGAWRGVMWQEPVPKSDQETQGLAKLGELIRDIALPKDADKKVREARCQ
jgi:TonB family protein